MHRFIFALSVIVLSGCSQAPQAQLLPSVPADESSASSHSGPYLDTSTWEDEEESVELRIPDEG